jgi:hypothetical protein
MVRARDGEERIVIFRTSTKLYTHNTPSRTTRHNYQNTHTAIFRSQQEAVESQRYAIDTLWVKVVDL